MLRNRSSGEYRPSTFSVPGGVLQKGQDSGFSQAQQCFGKYESVCFVTPALLPALLKEFRAGRAVQINERLDGNVSVSLVAIVEPVQEARPRFFVPRSCQGERRRRPDVVARVVQEA